MGYSRQHFTKAARQPRHARIPLCVTHCTECGVQLQHTHQIVRFGTHCRACFTVEQASSVVLWPLDGGQMASHEDAYVQR